LRRDPAEDGTRTFWVALLHSTPGRAAVGASGLTISSAVAQLGTFVSFVIVARIVNRSDLGAYASGMAIASVVVGGPGSGLPLFAMREVPAGRGGRAFVRRLVFLQLLVTCAGTAVAAALGGLLIGGRLGIGVAGAAGLSQVAISLLALAAALHISAGRYLPASVGRLVLGLGSAAVTAMMLAIGVGVVGAAGSIAIAGAAPALFLLATRPSDDQSAGGTGPSGPIRPWTFVGIGSVSGGYQRVDSVVLLAVSSSIAVGAYAAAYRFVGLFTLIITNFGAVWVSWLAGTSDIGEAWLARRRQVTLLLAGVVVPVAAFSIVFMHQLVALLYGEHLDGVVSPARILMLSVVAAAFYWPAVGYLTATGRESAWLKLLAGSVMADAIAVALLGRHWGATGAAASFLLVEIVTLTAVTWLSRSAAVRQAKGNRYSVGRATQNK
jgi:O-antigen/teichoic acid export membrane protein